MPNKETNLRNKPVQLSEIKLEQAMSDSSSEQPFFVRRVLVEKLFGRYTYDLKLQSATDTSVSYTHLDVYKRQRQRGAGEFWLSD